MEDRLRECELKIARLEGRLEEISRLIQSQPMLSPTPAPEPQGPEFQHSEADAEMEERYQKAMEKMREGFTGAVTYQIPNGNKQ